MWAALRSDLSEFVSIVTEDTTMVLNRMDDDFDEATTGVVPTSTGNNATYQRNRQNKNDDNHEASAVDDDDDDDDTYQQEALRRMKLLETYTAPLLGSEMKTVKPEAGEESEDMDAPTSEEENVEKARVDAFLQSFVFEEKADEIATILQQYPDTVGTRYRELVEENEEAPLSPEEFWQRYYYRCDPNRIAEEWIEYESSNAVTSGRAGPVLTTLTNFLGGAVKAVSATLVDEHDGPRHSGMSGIFQGKRPPFVLNTAVDESGDEEQEEEDEELGWDDEEEADGEEESHQIEFKDEQKEKLEESLKQALEERDQLQQTVHLQAKEIAALRKSGEIFTKAEVDHLKIQLFEKESEIAAIKAGQLSGFDVESKEAELASVVEALSKAEQKLAEVEAENALLQAKLAEKQPEANMSADYETKIDQLSDALRKSDEEKVSLKNELDDTKASLEAELTKTKAELATAINTISNLSRELDASKALRLVAPLSVTNPVDAEVESTKPIATIQSHSIAMSTEMKASPIAQKIPAAGDAEEDWGDDWGDE